MLAAVLMVQGGRVLPWIASSVLPVVSVPIAPPTPDPDRLLAALDAAPTMNDYLTWAAPMAGYAGAFLVVLFAFAFVGAIAYGVSKLA